MLVLSSNKVHVLDTRVALNVQSSTMNLRGHCSWCVSCSSAVGLGPAGSGRLSSARSLSVSAVYVLCLAMGKEETATWTALQHTAALLEQRHAGITQLVLLLRATRDTASALRMCPHETQPLCQRLCN